MTISLSNIKCVARDPKKNFCKVAEVSNDGSNSKISLSDSCDTTYISGEHSYYWANLKGKKVQEVQKTAGAIDSHCLERHVFMGSSGKPQYDYSHYGYVGVCENDPHKWSTTIFTQHKEPSVHHRQAIYNDDEPMVEFDI